jgi:ABC-type glycerol-3-phosphate transport system permease component
MAITLEHQRVATRSRTRYVVRHWIGLGLTWLTLGVALVFFLGPFFWILTTSVKAGEDYFAYPPVWIPSDASLKHYAGLFTRSSGARYSRTASSSPRSA